MKKLLIILMLTLSINIFANDTIRVDNNKIERIICDTTVNTKGKTVYKYYIMYDGELVSTSKTVIDKIKLCKKYNARIALAMVRTKANKRIILD